MLSAASSMAVSHLVVYLLVGALGVVRDVDVAHFDAVELPAELPDCDVAFLAYSVDDVAHVAPYALDSGVPVEQRPPLVRTEVGDFGFGFMLGVSKRAEKHVALSDEHVVGESLDSGCRQQDGVGGL